MELRDIEYFAAVAKHGHVGHAAESLGLSQPALSKSLRRLEKSMQARLVKRTPKGVELTPAGAMLLSQVSRLRLSLNDVARAVKDINEGRAGHLRIGAGTGIAGQLLPAACSALLKAVPKVTLEISIKTSEALAADLLSGELDLTINADSKLAHEHLIQEHLFEDEMIVVSSINHRLARQRRVTLSDVAQERWTLPVANVLSWQWMHRVFEDNGLAFPRIAMVGITSLRLLIVASSDLLGFSSRQIMQHPPLSHGLTELPVKELRWTRQISVGYRKDAYLAPAALRFIEILKATASKIAD